MMTDAIVPAPGGALAEAALRQALARGDGGLRVAGPMLRHLVTTDRSSLFSEEVVARVRGMLGDVARQLVTAHSDGGGGADGDAASRLATALAENDELLFHLHAAALEARIGERLRAAAALDPVLSPLLQALIATPETAEAAMHCLAAQARFGRNQLRMTMPRGELPAGLLHAALLVARTQAVVDVAPSGTAAPDADATWADAADASAARAEAVLRAG